MTHHDHRPTEVREQAQRQAEQARAAMEDRRGKEDGGISGWVAERAGEWDLDGQDETTLQGQKFFWNALIDYWFRMEIDGWEEIAEPPALLIRIRSAAPFVWAAWTWRVPVVAVRQGGGAGDVRVLIGGDRLSGVLRLDRLLRLKVFPLAVSLPWGIAPAALPQLPLPAKIRTRFMPAVELDQDADRADDEEYLDRKYREVQDSIQSGMDALARKRALPLF